MLLNGIWSAARELQQDILGLAARKHVIVADEKVPSAAGSIPGAEQPRHWLGVSTSRLNSSWWSVTIVGR
jgi:hypothetical protein